MKDIKDNIFKIKTKARIFISKIMTNIDEDTRKIYKKVAIFSICFLLICLCFSLVNNSQFLAYTVDADGALARYKSAFNTIWGWLWASAASIGCSLAAYNFLVIMTSKNVKKIEQSFAWIKAIFMAFIFLGISGAIVGAVFADFNTIQSNSANSPLFNY